MYQKIMKPWKLQGKMIQQIVKEWESLLDISENESILDDEHFEIICKTYDK